MFFTYKTIAAALASLTVIGGVTAYQGDVTWYEPGWGACGAYSAATDYVVALSVDQFAGGANCYEHIGVWYGENFVDVTIVDECEGCDEYDLDLSPSAFEQLASLDTGEISAGWYYE